MSFHTFYISKLILNSFSVFTDLEALIDEAKSMNAVGKYNENIVNLQGVCFDKPDGRNLRNVSVLFRYLSFPNKESYNLPKFK